MKEIEPAAGNPPEESQHATTTHIAALLRAHIHGSPIYRAPVASHLGPVPFFSHQRAQLPQPQPQAEETPAANRESETGFLRAQRAIKELAHPADYGYPYGMRGFPPPDWLLHEWRQQWDKEESLPLLEQPGLPPAQSEA